jgi:hypothetical protein
MKTVTTIKTIIDTNITHNEQPTAIHADNKPAILDDNKPEQDKQIL